MLEFDHALPSLVLAYEEGLLVPFLGAGMSRPRMNSWPTFVAALETRAGVPAETVDDASNLIRRAYRASRVLKRDRDASKFTEAVRAALGERPEVRTLQTEALAASFWPLVVTTNYDSVFVQANNAKGRRSTILGRRTEHCSRVLASLDAPSESSLIWALQGYLGTDAELSNELVVSHEEYRAVTHTNPAFRRAFGEVYRRRSLFFLGASLNDPYLLDLFGEVVEMYGHGHHVHYAMIARDADVDCEFIEERFGIVTILYEQHEHLPGLLGEFAKKHQGSRFRQRSWGFQWNTPQRLDSHHVGHVRIVRGGLPLSLEDGEGLAISAGVDGNVLALGNQVEVLATHLSARRVAFPELQARDGHVTVIEEAPNLFIVAARVRNDGDERHPKAIFDAMVELLSTAAQSVVRLHCPLFAAGPGRAFPEYVSFVAMLRAIAFWRIENVNSDLEVVIHVVTPSVFANLESGRIDLRRILSVPSIRFRVEVVPTAPVARITRPLETVVLERPYGCSLQELARRFHISLASEWTYEVIPAPTRRHAAAPLTNESGALTLLDLGVVDGSTIRFVQQEPSRGDGRSLSMPTSA